MVADVARASGLDLRLEAQSPSLLAAAQTSNLSPAADVRITVGARLSGDLAALSLVSVSAEMIGSGGDYLELSGSLGNVWEGSRLDGRITLMLDPACQLGTAFLPVRHIANQIEAVARVAGSVAAPVFDAISAEIRGPGDGNLRLAASVRVATTGGVRLESFDLSATFVVPDPSAFADQLGFDPLGVGGVARLRRVVVG